MTKPWKNSRFCERRTMTVSDILRETAALGFNEVPDNLSLFYGALSRAVVTVDRLRPTVRTYTVEQKAGGAEGVYRGYADYDIAALVPDFLTFASPVSSESDFRVREGHILSLPLSFTGKATVLYRPVLPSYAEGDEDKKIPLPDDLCRLLPLLCAASLCFEADPERASFWLQSYFTEAKALERLRSPISRSGVTVVDGWC